MTHDAQQEANTDQILQLLQYVTEVAPKLISPHPDELFQLQNQLTEIRSQDIPLSIDHPLTFYRISSILYRNPKMTMGELSRALSVPLSTATRMIDWLVHNGYAQRLPDPDDRRVVRVALTDMGNQFHEVVERFFVRSIQQIIGCLTAEERTILFTLLGKIMSA